MFENITPTLKSVISTICYHSNLKNLIFVGSFADFIHYKRKNYEPIKPKDLDIIVPSINDLGDLRYKLELSGPFENPVYDEIFSHKQYYFDLLGVRVDIFVANNLEEYNKIKTDSQEFYGHLITINSKEQSMENQLKYIKLFEKYKDSMELYRLRKHSKRLAFYNMLDNNIL